MRRTGSNRSQEQFQKDFAEVNEQLKAQGHEVERIGFDQTWATKNTAGFLNKINLACNKLQDATYVPFA